jgi:large subunit ribosomal protein L30e
VYKFPGTSLELGAACGKPFAVSVLTVLAPGESSIMSLLK